MELTQRIEKRNDTLAISCRLTGDYSKVNYASAWQTLEEYYSRQKIANDCAEAEYLCVYQDDPQVTPPEKCRVDACIAADRVKDLQPAGDVGVNTIAGGQYIVFQIKGSFNQFPEAYALIYGKLLSEAGVKVLHKPVFERYLRKPQTTLPQDLVSEIWIPIEETDNINW